MESMLVIETARSHHSIRAFLDQLHIFRTWDAPIFNPMMNILAAKTQHFGIFIGAASLGIFRDPLFSMFNKFHKSSIILTY